MPPPDEHHEHKARDAAIDAGLGGAAALAGAVNPAAGIAATMAVAPVSASAKQFLGWVGARRAGRQASVLKWAADRAGIAVEQLDRRCRENPYLEELLLNTLDATGRTALGDKLVAYAVALANGLDASSTQDTVTGETKLVRALEPLDANQFELLKRFTWSYSELGLPAEDPVAKRLAPEGSPPHLAESQLQVVAPDPMTLPLALAVLQREGLLANKVTGGTGALASPPAELAWCITDFGRDLVERLHEVGDLLHPTDEHAT